MKEFQLTRTQKAKLANRKHNKEAKAKIDVDKERQDHIKWCKEKAVKTIEAGDAKGALISFNHDMRAKHVTNFHPALLLIPKIIDEFCTSTDMREFIEGFN